MRRSLKVGDRVSWIELYKAGPDHADQGTRYCGEVQKIEGRTAYVTDTDKSRYAWVPLQSLRSITKKPRREFWICPSPDHKCWCPGHKQECRQGMCIRVYEVRLNKGEKK